MTYVRAFLPWIVYAVFPHDDWQWGALAAFAIAVVLIVQHRMAGRPADALIIEIGSAVFFAAFAAIAFADPHAGVHPYSAGLSNAMLFLVAGISLAVRRPFTLGIAKLTTPRDYWGQPLFVRTNVIITSVWTASFAVSALVLLVLAGVGGVPIGAIIAVQAAGLVVPIVFTNRYAAHVVSRIRTS